MLARMITLRITTVLLLLAVALMVSACGGTAQAGNNDKYAGITSDQARHLAIQDVTKMEMWASGTDLNEAHANAEKWIGQVKKTYHVVCNGMPFWKVGHVYESLKRARFGCNDSERNNGYTTYFTVSH